MSLHVVDTLVHERRPRKLCRVGSTGPLSSRTPTIFANSVWDVKWRVESHVWTWCPLPNSGSKIFWLVGHWFHGTLSNFLRQPIHFGSHRLCFQVGGSYTNKDEWQLSCHQVFKRKYHFTLRSPPCDNKRQRESFLQSDFWIPNVEYSISHKLSTVYHPQTNGQVKVTNKQIKLILEKTVGQNWKDWLIKLIDAL